MIIDIREHPLILKELSNLAKKKYPWSKLPTQEDLLKSLLAQEIAQTEKPTLAFYLSPKLNKAMIIMAAKIAVLTGRVESVHYTPGFSEYYNIDDSSKLYRGKVALDLAKEVAVPGSSVTELSVRYVNLVYHDYESFLKTLARANITHLDISNNNISDSGALVVKEWEKLTKLTSLNISDNLFGDPIRKTSELSFKMLASALVLSAHGVKVKMLHGFHPKDRVVAQKYVKEFCKKLNSACVTEVTEGVGDLLTAEVVNIVGEYCYPFEVIV